MCKDTQFSPFALQIGEKKHFFDRPAVMGIVNVTPDSFYDGSRCQCPQAVVDRVGEMLSQGADIIDLGAHSTRPGAVMLAPQEEADRLVPAVELVRSQFPEAVISVDSFQSLPATLAVEAGADIVNDVSGGLWDPQLLPAVARLGVPYVLSHNVPLAQRDAVPCYGDVAAEVIDFLRQRLALLKELGISQVFVDPEFGFAKSLEHNYALFARLGDLRAAFPNQPLLVGVSRKSMITKLLGITAQEALNGTTALHALALAQGAQMLRVHDVSEAVQAVKIFCAVSSQSNPNNEQ